jgi:transposase
MVRYTVKDFNREFPDDAACLEWLFQDRYPGGILRCSKCTKLSKHHRVKSRLSYSCDHCGHHVHPTAGTIFHKSTTHLHLWFYAVYLMAQTRCGISAKQIQRETGVTYKTAWRMWNRIRKLLCEDVGLLKGTVEVDETYIGGKRRYANRLEASRRWRQDKQTVVGHVERGGMLVTSHLPHGQRAPLKEIVQEFVLPASMIYTDEAEAYTGLRAMGYQHRRVNHSKKIYVRGNVHTNTIEGFFGLLKRGISGVYHSVSAKYLQDYLNEYTFRYNHRNDTTPMFATILSRIAVGLRA